MPSTFEGVGVQGGASQESARGAGSRNGAPDVAPEPALARPGDQRDEGQGLVVEELLVEDISIDGMCGVY